MRAYLDKKWGAPRVIKDSTGTEEYYYDNPADGIRAKLDRSHFLRYSQVMSRDQLFGTDPKLWGFEKAPLIGQSQADIENQLARYHHKPRKEDAST